MAQKPPRPTSCFSGSFPSSAPNWSSKPLGSPLAGWPQRSPLGHKLGQWMMPISQNLPIVPIASTSPGLSLSDYKWQCINTCKWTHSNPNFVTFQDLECACVYANALSVCMKNGKLSIGRFFCSLQCECCSPQLPFVFCQCPTPPVCPTVWSTF